MPKRLKFACLTLVAALLVAGCVPPEVAIETATPTQSPATATIAPTTAPASPTAPPAATDTSAPPPATATTVPAATETSAPAATPTADPAREVILILEPGLTSSVTSPVRVAGEADSTFEQNLVIQITDQDGAVLTTTPTTIQSEMGTRGPFSADVAFSVAADQPGRISVYSASARDGGLVHLASVEVTLLAGGTAAINPAAPHDEVHQIFEPNLLETATGGHVHLEGFSEYVFEGTLNLALCGEGGSGAPEPICGTADNTLATGFTMLQSPDIGQPGTYATDLTYTVAGPTRARLVVYSLSARDGGLLHLSSVEITVAP
jgi:hypothetical protein